MLSGLSTFTTMAQVQSLVGELRSGKPCGMVKKKYYLFIMIVLITVDSLSNKAVFSSICINILCPRFKLFSFMEKKKDSGQFRELV